MSVALTMIACYVHAMQKRQPGKFQFNLPLFALHLFMMWIDTAMRIIGATLKY
jgi:hypothetical protein